MGGAPGRLMEPGERKGRPQFELRAPVRARSRRQQIGVLGAGGTLGIGLQEDVAANAVQEGVGQRSPVCLASLSASSIRAKAAPRSALGLPLRSGNLALSAA